MQPWALTVGAEAAGQRLDRLLASRWPRDGSRAAWQQRIAAGVVRINGVVVRRCHQPVRLGDRIVAEPAPPAPSGLTPEAIPLAVIYEDEALLVVDKPAGLVVHPAPGHRGGTLVNALLAHTDRLAISGDPQRPGIVHRLDRETSGLLLVAKSDTALRALSRQFHDRTVERRYLAVVRGRLEPTRGEIRLPIGRSRMDRQKMGVRWESRRDAITRYRVREHLRQATVVELQPVTGRTHQLRVHLAYLGHPILGDRAYGGTASSWMIKRQLLHAMTLGFRHPVTGQPMVVRAPVPEEMIQAIERLGGSSESLRRGGGG